MYTLPLTPSKSGTPTNALVSLTGTESERKWSEYFPPMPTKRHYPAVVCSGTSLVAVGGWAEEGLLSTVEVMDTGTDMPQWFTATSPHHPFTLASATICGDNLYLLGGWYENGRTKSVLTCSLTALLQSCQPQPLEVKLNTLSLAEDPGVWHRVADVPVYRSTCTTLCGQLLAVGGLNDGYENSDAVYKYDPTKNIWNIISHTPSTSSYPLVVPLPGDNLVVCYGEKVCTASIIQH